MEKCVHFVLRMNKKIRRENQCEKFFLGCLIQVTTLFSEEVPCVMNVTQEDIDSS